VIATYYNRERVGAEVEARSGWDGWWVAEDGAGDVVAVGGGMTSGDRGEVLVLYADPARRRQGGGSAVLEAITGEQRAGGPRESGVGGPGEPAPDRVLRAARVRAGRRARAVDRAAVGAVPARAVAPAPLPPGYASVFAFDESELFFSDPPPESPLFDESPPPSPFASDFLPRRP
jgi:GNAT superfamily N-acetyltransferase